MKNFKYCPNCRKEILNEPNFYKCKSCEFLMYKHSSATGSVLPVKDGKVLLAIRGQEPFKGQPDIIGGFCDYGESPQNAAIREAKEESNLNIETVDILGIYMDEYPLGEDVVPTLNTVFVGKIMSGEPKALDDVASLKWYPIDSLPIKEISFESQKKTLMDLQDWFETRGIV